MSNSAEKDLVTCLRCGKKDPNLLRVDSGLRLTLSKMGQPEPPDDVCGVCLKELKERVRKSPEARNMVHELIK